MIYISKYNKLQYYACLFEFKFKFIYLILVVVKLTPYLIA